MALAKMNLLYNLNQYCVLLHEKLEKPGACVLLACHIFHALYTLISASFHYIHKPTTPLGFPRSIIEKCALSMWEIFLNVR